MAITITWPENTVEAIDAIRSGIGREVTFMLEHKEDCPTCDINPITDLSSNPFCPTCSGFGYVYVYSGYSITAHITWAPSDTMNWVTGGQFFKEDCGIQIKKTPETVIVANEARWVEVDDKKLAIKNKVYRGVPTLNRILLDLKEL